MTKNKFTEEQVVKLLQEAESGAKTVVDICREMGITNNTAYAWKQQFVKNFAFGQLIRFYRNWMKSLVARSNEFDEAIKAQRGRSAGG